MIDTKALRSRILDLAIQGKLTEQLPSDGTAEELYQQIQAEKQALIKEGKIKKEKPLPEISADEIPFEIPNNWKWVRISSICSIINGDRGKNYPAKSSLKNEGIPFISALNLNGKNVTVDEQLMCLSDEQYDALGNGKLIKDDIAICIRGSLGKHGRYQFDKGAIASSLVISRFPIERELLGNYEMLWLDSTMFPLEIKKYDSGTAQPNLAAESLSKFLYPLPPLEEQKRIVERVEEIFRLLDTIDEAQEKYSADSQILKAKLITAGIQGKLTKQLPSDGSAQELYQQIQAEKQKLIKEGKLKKEKPLPPVSPEEVPFEIPQNWMWVRLGEICSIINGDRGKNYPAKSTLKHKGIPFISALNLNGKDVTVNDKLMCLSDEQYELLGNGKLIMDDVVVCIRGSLGKHGRYQFDKGAIASSLVISRFQLENKILGNYEMLWLDSTMFPLETKKYDSGTAQPNLAAENLAKFLYPLPPLAEQKRIADVLERALGEIG